MQTNSKLKIGVVFHGNPLAGGGFHDGLSSTLLVYNLKKDFDLAFYTPVIENAQAVKTHGIDIKLLKFGKIHKLGYKSRKNNLLFSLFRSFKKFPALDDQFEKDGVNLVYFTGPNPICLFLERLNFVLPVWDLCHRDHPEFPEVRESFEFEARENFLNRALPKAAAIIAESPFGRDALIRRYKVDPEKVHFVWKPPSTKILSFASAVSDFDPKKFTEIPDNADYIFYPAQFWAHKNHRLILYSVHHLKSKHGYEIYAVFCGSDCGNLESILNYSRELKIENLVKYVGFAPDEHIPNYYRKSLALVMPSLFGPTNMPPVEAFVLGTPVIVANLPGFKDQVGDAGILIDPYDAVSLSKAIIELADDKIYRQKLIERGRKRALSFSDDERLRTLNKIFVNFAKKLALWQFVKA